MFFYEFYYYIIRNQKSPFSGMLLPMIIYNNTIQIEHILKLESSDDIYPNVREDILTEASKIFLYLNFCPTPEMMSMMKSFESFFTNKTKKVWRWINWTTCKNNFTAETNALFQLWLLKLLSAKWGLPQHILTRQNVLWESLFNWQQF